MRVPSRRGSSTTARASTPACSPSAARKGWAVGRLPAGDAPGAARAACPRSPRPADCHPDELPVAIDGCGVPTWAMPLRRMARAFSHLEELEGGDVGRRGDARAPGADSRPAGGRHAARCASSTGWSAKGGAEGLLCAAGPGGLGVARQGRGRRHACDAPGGGGAAAPARVSRPATSVLSRWRTRAASSSARSSPSGSEVARIRLHKFRIPL